MLGMKKYDQSYIDACRSKVEADLRAYRKVVGKGKPADGAARDFESTFFNNLVIKLEYMFVHRLSGTEGKDGNPLNEKRAGRTC